MKLYRHYKQKLYKYFGTVTHSETLERMAYYECLYDNSEGQFWVRPLNLWEGSLEVENKTVRRFEKVELEIETRTQVQEAEIQILSRLIEDIFGQWDSKWFNSRIQIRNRVGLHLAKIEDKIVGFKLGYAEDEESYYSWLGGVIPSYQNLGIAADLMKAQHQWCRAQGYKKVLTTTQNRFRNMLYLNIKSGFEIIGTKTSDDSGGIKILMEKRLNPASET